MTLVSPRLRLPVDYGGGPCPRFRRNDGGDRGTRLPSPGARVGNRSRSSSGETVRQSRTGGHVPPRDLDRADVHSLPEPVERRAGQVQGILQTCLLNLCSSEFDIYHPPFHTCVSRS